MKLNEEQMEIMRNVREHYDGSYRGFICITIGAVGYSMARSNALSEKDRGIEIRRMRGITSELETEIQRAIGEFYTMDNWVYVETGFSCDLKFGDSTPKRATKEITTKLFREYMVMARTAWLDKILETGEIS